MRKIALIVGIFALFIIVAVVIFAATFNINQYHGQIQSALKTQLGRQVSLGNMHLGIFPPRFEVENVSVADDPRFNAPKPFVQAQRLDVSVKFLPLLHKEVEVDSIILQRPSVELIKNKQGVWNFASLGKPQPESPQSVPNAEKQMPANKPQPSASTGEPQSGPQQFSLGKLEIRDGQVSVTDLQTSLSPSVYDHIDVTLENFAPGQPFTIAAAAHLPGPGSQEVRLKGKGGPVVQNDPAATPFHGTLNLKQVGIAALSKFLNSPALAGTDGTLSGQTDINSQSGTLSAKGQMKVENAKLHGTELGYPIAADYDVSDNVTNSLLTIHNGNIKLGSTPLLIRGMVNSKPTPALIDLNLQANNVSLTELAKLAAATGTALPPGTNVTGNVNADVNARGSVDKPALNGTVKGQNIQMSGKDIALPIQIQAINLKLTPTQIQSAPFNMVSGGTTVNAQFDLQQYLSNSPLINATLKAPGAQLQSILSIAKAYGVSGLEKISGNGIINLDMHAAGPVKGVTSAEIMRALNGTTALNVSNLRYTGVDLSHELASIGGFLRSAQPAKGFTDVAPLTGDIVVKNGIAQTSNLQAKLDIGSIAGVGTANLVDQTLNLHLTAVLSQAFSQQVGGTGIGGLMKTALANNQGELAIPVLVTGTFQNPKFMPDVQQMTQMRLKGLIPNSNNPGAAVSGLLGGLLGQKGANATPAPGQPQQAQPGQNPQQNAVEQIMGILGGKKKQQQNPPPK
ncbi:MAG TPA: AsmA family protein [Terriglobales bacterium]|nr:AsmA family protein [Terriglobales bacterium]